MTRRIVLSSLLTVVLLLIVATGEPPSAASDLTPYDRHAVNEDLDFLDPFFLGPAAENGQLLEDLMVEFLRDHVHWRRSFHPEDGRRIAPSASTRPDYLEFQARIRTELYSLSAELKQAVPFFHPRYVGPMNSDLLLAGLVARMATTLYNPDNVSEEAAQIALDKELAVGEQLAQMFGYSVDESCEPCAWRHLTSGGTVANYEGLGEENTWRPI